MFGIGEILLALDLRAGRDIPEAELRLEPPRSIPLHPAGHQTLRARSLPRAKIWQRIKGRLLLGVAVFLKRREIARTAQVVDDHARHQRAILARKIRDGDRHGLECALAQINHKFRAGQAAPEVLRGRRHRQENCGGKRVQTASQHIPCIEIDDDVAPILVIGLKLGRNPERRTAQRR